jgi:hypothetical protein
MVDAVTGAPPPFFQFLSTFGGGPRISKTNGGSRWLVVYTHFGTVQTTEGAFLEFSSLRATPTPTIASGSFLPAVSSPMQPAYSTARYYLCVHQKYETATNSIDVDATLVSDSGMIILTDNLPLREGTGQYLGWSQTNASVDSDGCRFVVGYHERYQGNQDYDSLVSTFTWQPGWTSLLCNEARRQVNPGTTPITDDDTEPVIAAAYGRSPLLVMEFGIAGHHAGPSAPPSIRAYRYRGFGPGGIGFPLGFGCGSAAMIIDGVAALGQRMSFHMPVSGPLTGFLFGFPGSWAIPGCPSCLVGVVGGVTVPNPYAVTVPNLASLAGMRLAIQSFSAAGGPCLGMVSLGPLATLTIQ